MPVALHIAQHRKGLLLHVVTEKKKECVGKTCQTILWHMGMPDNYIGAGGLQNTTSSDRQGVSRLPQAATGTL